MFKRKSFGIELVQFLFHTKYKNVTELEEFGSLLMLLSPSLRIAVGGAIINSLIFQYDNAKLVTTIRNFLTYFYSNINASIFSSNGAQILFEFTFNKFLEEINTDEGYEWLCIIHDVLNEKNLQKKCGVVEGIRVIVEKIVENNRDDLDKKSFDKLEDLLLVF